MSSIHCTKSHNKSNKVYGPSLARATAQKRRKTFKMSSSESQDKAPGVEVSIIKGRMATRSANGSSAQGLKEKKQKTAEQNPSPKSTKKASRATVNASPTSKTKAPKASSSSHALQSPKKRKVACLDDDVQQLDMPSLAGALSKKKKKVRAQKVTKEDVAVPKHLPNKRTRKAARLDYHDFQQMEGAKKKRKVIVSDSNGLESVTIATATLEINQTQHSIPKELSKIFKKCYYNKGKLDKAGKDAAAISDYTGPGWGVINKALRIPVFSPNDLRGDVRVRIDAVDAALSKLRSRPAHVYQKEVYRGTTLPDSLVQELQVGATFSDRAFLSTSMNRNKAFIGKEDSSKWLFVIGSKTGLNISSFSQNKGEEEVLFRRNTMFRIQSVDSDKKVVAMEELH